MLLLLYLGFGQSACCLCKGLKDFVLALQQGCSAQDNSTAQELMSAVSAWDKTQGTLPAHLPCKLMHASTRSLKLQSYFMPCSIIARNMDLIHHSPAVLVTLLPPCLPNSLHITRE